MKKFFFFVGSSAYNSNIYIGDGVLTGKCKCVYVFGNLNQQYKS